MLRALISTSPVAMRVVDIKLRVRYVNDSYMRFVKADAPALVGYHCYNFVNGSRPCEPCPLVESLQTGKSQMATRKDMLPDGSTIHYDEYVIPLIERDGVRQYALQMLIDRSREMLFRENNTQTFAGLVAMFASFLDMKDDYTANHSHMVTEVGVKLGKYIGLTEGECFELQLSSLLHDIGKIVIPDGIIRKPGKLTSEEFAVIRSHPAETMKMLDNLSQFGAIRDMAGHHHERWDGEGYPDHLQGEEIPLGARIIAIADTYDAMTSNRSYRDAMSHHAAMDEIADNAGSQFDPLLAEMFLEMAGKLYDSRKKLGELDDSPAQDRDGKYVLRRFSTARVSSRVVPGQNILKTIPEDALEEALIAKSPISCSLVDSNLRVVYPNTPLRRGTRSLPVRPLAMANTTCFEADDGGRTRNPVFKAFQTGQVQEVKSAMMVSGENFYVQVFGVPVEFRDAGGKRLRCVMEMRIDRTSEMEARMAMTGDARALLDMLYRLVPLIETSTDMGGEKILQECEAFTNYLTETLRKFRQLTDGETRVVEW